MKAGRAPSEGRVSLSCRTGLWRRGGMEEGHARGRAGREDMCGHLTEVFLNVIWSGCFLEKPELWGRHQ